MVNTEISRFAPLWLRTISWPLRAFLLRTPAKGAETPVWLATSEDAAALQSGSYLYDKQRIEASEAARSEENAMLLWKTMEAQAAAR